MDLSFEELKKYAHDAGAVGAAIEGLQRHDGWNLFIALFERRKHDIKNKSDYGTLEEFKTDRKGIEIVDDLIANLEQLIVDAFEAQTLLSTADPAQEDKNRGIMLLESMEREPREG